MSPSDRARDRTPDAPALAGSWFVAVVRGAGGRAARWTRGAALYRWLTAEPDPDVIVIDLRETRTVGPVLRVLDRVVDALAGAAAGSRAVGLARDAAETTRATPLRVAGLALSALGLVVATSALRGGPATTALAVGLALAVAGLVVARDTRDWATLRETRPVELAIAAFEPPEPPGRDGTEENGDGDDGDDAGDEDDASDEPDADRVNEPDADTVNEPDAGDDDPDTDASDGSR